MPLFVLFLHRTACFILSGQNHFKLELVSCMQLSLKIRLSSCWAASLSGDSVGQWFLQNHRMVNVGRDLCRSSGPTSRLPKTMTRWLLKIYKKGDCSASLVYLLPCSKTCTVKKCFLVFKLGGTSYVPVGAHQLLSWHWTPLKRPWIPLCTLLPQ